MQSTLGATAIIEVLIEEKADDKIINDYEKLNERCEQVITKIRERKNKKDKKNSK